MKPYAPQVASEKQKAVVHGLMQGLSAKKAVKQAGYSFGQCSAPGRVINRKSVVEYMMQMGLDPTQILRRLYVKSLDLMDSDKTKDFEVGARIGMYLADKFDERSKQQGAVNVNIGIKGEMERLKMEEVKPADMLEKFEKVKSMNQIEEEAREESRVRDVDRRKEEQWLVEDEEEE